MNGGESTSTISPRMASIHRYAMISFPQYITPAIWTVSAWATIEYSSRVSVFEYRGTLHAFIAIGVTAVIAVWLFVQMWRTWHQAVTISVSDEALVVGGVNHALNEIEAMWYEPTSRWPGRTLRLVVAMRNGAKIHVGEEISGFDALRHRLGRLLGLVPTCSSGCTRPLVRAARRRRRSQARTVHSTDPSYYIILWCISGLLAYPVALIIMLYLIYELLVPLGADRGPLAVYAIPGTFVTLALMGRWMWFPMLRTGWIHRMASFRLSREVS